MVVFLIIFCVAKKKKTKKNVLYPFQFWAIFKKKKIDKDMLEEHYLW